MAVVACDARLMMAPQPLPYKGKGRQGIFCIETPLLADLEIGDSRGHALSHPDKAAMVVHRQPAFARLNGAMHTSTSSLAHALQECSTPQDRAAAIQGAIDAQAAAGGGTVRLPAGVWRITTITLRSGITLDLPFACVIEAHDDLADYPRGAVFVGNKDRQPYHLIAAHDCENVGIIGDGVIDGRGPAFWHPPMRELAAQGVDVDAYCDEHQLPAVYRNRNHPWYREKKQRVSPLCDLVRCQGLTLRGITIRNSPGWTVHLHDCDDVSIHGITIRNNLLGPNTDGLDINGCHDVRISDCDLTCGDDAIILKSMDDARTCERITVSNCILASNCAALGIGAEIVHAIRDVTFTGCVIRQALRAVQIEMWDAGLVENIVVSDISGTCDADVPLQRAIYVDIQHHGRTDGALGRCRNLIFSNIALRCRGRSMFTAADGAVIEHITLRDIQITYPCIEDPQESVAAQSSSQMSNDCPETRDKPAAIVCDNVHYLLMDNVRAIWPGADVEEVVAAANNAVNPFHGNIPMHGCWLRRVRHAVIRCPFLRAHDPHHTGMADLVDTDCSDLEHIT